MSIPKSELILNPDGSIYHLGLLPAEVANTIITVGDPERVTQIATQLDQVHFDRTRREFHTVKGRLGNKELTIISTGIGTDNIDIVLNELDALVNIDLVDRKHKKQRTQLTVVRLGTSGAIRSEIPIDSLLISRFAIGLDGLLHYYKAEDIRLSQIENQCNRLPSYYAVAGDEDLHKSFASLGPAGITLTANGFYAPQSRKLTLAPKIDLISEVREIKHAGLKVTNLEMETAGIYGLAQLLGHRAISINAILANRVTGGFSSQPQNTIKSMIDRSLEIIEGL